MTSEEDEESGDTVGLMENTSAAYLKTRLVNAAQAASPRRFSLTPHNVGTGPMRSTVFSFGNRLTASPHLPQLGEVGEARSQAATAAANAVSETSQGGAGGVAAGSGSQALGSGQSSGEAAGSGGKDPYRTGAGSIKRSVGLNAMLSSAANDSNSIANSFTLSKKKSITEQATGGDFKLRSILRRKHGSSAGDSNFMQKFSLKSAPKDVRFDSESTLSQEHADTSSHRGQYVDQLALERSSRSHGPRTAHLDHFLIGHRDSLIKGKPDTMEMDQNPGGEKASVGINVAAVADAAGLRCLQLLPAFASCSVAFLNDLVASAEKWQLKAGEAREVNHNSQVSGVHGRPTAAVVVQSGACRIEVNRIPIEECAPGSAFGIAVLMAGISGVMGREGGVGAGAALDMSVRARQEGCHCLILRSAALRRALAEHAADQVRLRGLLHMVNRNFDSTQSILATLQSTESAKTAVMRGSTRHLRMPGQVLCQQGKRNPDGLIVLRSGTVALEIGGVEVRRVSEGQTLGAELLLNISQKWSTTVRCTTPCDVQILHRRLFTSLVHDMIDGTSEEEREAQRLLLLIEGRWKEDRVLLSWPIFRGYDAEFLGTLAKLLETRVVFPMIRVWESSATGREGHEVALYFLLHGSCDEAPLEVEGRGGREGGRHGKRTLSPGSCIGFREFLMLRDAKPMVVTARTMCLVAVLHRSVFLNAVDHHPKELRSPEVNRLLGEEIDRVDPVPASALPGGTATEEGQNSESDATLFGCEQLIGALPLLRGCDKRFATRLSSKASRNLCMAGQRLCRSGAESSSLFIVARGEARMHMAGLHIRSFTRGEAFNILAVSIEAFVPRYTVACERASELWSITHTDFLAALESFSSEKRRLNTLLSTPLQAWGVTAGSPGPKRFSMDAARALHRHGNDRIDEPSSTASIAPPFDLSTIDLFRSCSLGFLVWIRDHLETVVHFPDAVVVRENSTDECMYFLCIGTIILEGSSTQQKQVSLGRGAVFGEQRLLEVEEVARATATAVEITMLQVLHTNVFRSGLELFKSEVPRFEQVAVQWLNASEDKDITQVPFFSGCAQDFVLQVARFLRSRLVHRGGVIVEAGAEGDRLFILRSGSASMEYAQKAIGAPAKEKGGLVGGGLAVASPAGAPPTGVLPAGAQLGGGASGSDKPESGAALLQASAVLNAAAVLGIQSRAEATVRAEQVCAVAEIDAVSFLTILNRFPQEVMRLLQVVAGRLWPMEADAVPLFRGVSMHFFNQLMGASEWHMFLPKQCVVRQGGHGNLMYLLCHGTAITKASGLILGAPLAQGDLFGAANFFGIRDKYRISVWSQTVCHFRIIPPAQLEHFVKENPAEKERFDQLKQQVQRDADEYDKLQTVEVAREKLRRRVNDAFQKHVASNRRLRMHQKASETGDAVAVRAALGLEPEVRVKEVLASRRGSEKNLAKLMQEEVEEEKADDEVVMRRKEEDHAMAEAASFLDSNEIRRNALRSAAKGRTATKHVDDSKADGIMAMNAMKMRFSRARTSRGSVHDLRQYFQLHGKSGPTSHAEKAVAVTTVEDSSSKDHSHGEDLGMKMSVASISAEAIAAQFERQRQTTQGRARRIRRRWVFGSPHGVAERQLADDTSPSPGNSAERKNLSSQPGTASTAEGKRKKKSQHEGSGGGSGRSSGASSSSGSGSGSGSGSSSCSSSESLTDDEVPETTRRGSFQMKVTLTDTGIGKQKDDEAEEVAQASSQSDFFYCGRERADSPESKLDIVESAISGFIEDRNAALLRGKALRLLYSGGGGSLSEDELHELSSILPTSLPPLVDNSPKSARGPGVRQGGSKEATGLRTSAELRRRFREVATTRPLKGIA